ncbi:hypothetical protein MAR_016099 [Mya arenaria]|uniref:Uncharacterized protein n=1 Tax=Mya arenaria TaxID=6604 RepID=A0ABY7FJ64_MYAAR|nr:hypothetical protein MAR_016099 [Mya arenaria]
MAFMNVIGMLKGYSTIAKHIFQGPITKSNTSIPNTCQEDNIERLRIQASVHPLVHKNRGKQEYSRHCTESYFQRQHFEQSSIVTTILDRIQLTVQPDSSFIDKQIDKLCIKKATGADGISSKLYKIMPLSTTFSASSENEHLNLKPEKNRQTTLAKNKATATAVPDIETTRACYSLNGFPTDVEDGKPHGNHTKHEGQGSTDDDGQVVAEVKQTQLIQGVEIANLLTRER